MKPEQWQVGIDDNDVVDVNGRVIASCLTWGVDNEAKAEQIVREHNAYPKLVEALEGIAKGGDIFNSTHTAIRALANIDSDVEKEQE